jgi:hypothetical protein
MNKTEYWDEIHEIAETYNALWAIHEDDDPTEEQKKRCDDAGYPDGCEPGDWLWERLDSDSWVICTHSAKEVLRHTRNEDYAVGEWGMDSIVQDGTLNWSALALGAMYGDVMGALA